jgi:uncharacterized protein (DUF983 family)
MKDVSALKSITQCKCPRCRKGKVFKYGNHYHRKFGQIEKKCSHCGLVYEMEQGFWYGAMYVSYGLGVIIAIPVMLIISYLTMLEIYEITFIIFLILLLLMPLLFRYSRIIWLHIFIRYDEEKALLEK